MTAYRAGLDVGSTTVKLVILSSGGDPVFSAYRRHRANIRETLSGLLAEARAALGDAELRLLATGSGSLALSGHLGVGFAQEVAAEAEAVSAAAPQTDVVIELGGEDAKIIYFTGGLEERMNGVCAGGTGSFIDQMAALLQTDADGLNEYAKGYRQLYPIAARCGVFAKSDVQPLINEGATREDLAASILQAVVDQTVSGLACGKPIRGRVCFLGGPLNFLSELRAAFVRTLKLTPEQTIVPRDPHLFPALGAALLAEKAAPVRIGELERRLAETERFDFGLKRLAPLFAGEDELTAFRARHARARVRRGELAAARECYLGVDAGSTTTKLALIDGEGRLLWSFYANNSGSPVRTAMRAMAELAEVFPAGAVVRGSCSTGYGEGLLKTALRLDEGEVETVAHCTAAAFFDPQVDCVLDIGGQDMKCLKLKNGAVDSIMLNEACSSGCGSFLENFAVSMGLTAAEFSRRALFAAEPVDLGTRCTVFMNSNVRQAQKEGASLSDIAAGLAYSVVKNALYKVIKLSDPAALGKRVVVQGGTFHSEAVLRAFEVITGREAVCPDIAGLMGAYGAALIARDRAGARQVSGMLSFAEIAALAFKSATVRCGRCANNCLLTVNTFSDGRRHVTGNRCERGLGKTERTGEKLPNLMAYKYERIFAYPPLAPEAAPRGVVGIPRVLNLYENYPFWATFFKALGFSVALSPRSDRKVYAAGIESIPSESECYPAKLAHGHIQTLIDSGVRTIFYPSVYYERKETPGANNSYNCPMVIGYPENIANNVEDIYSGQKVRYLHPFLSFADEKTAEERLTGFMAEEFGVPEAETRAAARGAWAEMLRAKADVRAEGARALAWMEQNGRKGIVLAGRPYHCDPEINHGIPEMINSFGLAVLTEDSLTPDFTPSRPLRVNDQWSYHSRLYTAAEFVCRRTDLELIQINSFGCGLDAVTADQVAEILEQSGRLYTLLKIDEVSNLGAARIRLRSLIAASNARACETVPDESPKAYDRAVFTREMKDAGYTILAPQMSPIHFDLIGPVFRMFGYNVVILDNDNREAVETGLRCVNNDACYPSLIMTGQILNAVLSGRYDTDRLAVLMSQTGGCCRATNYIGFIRRALAREGLGHIPVISLNMNGMEKNPGFSVTLPMIVRGGAAIVLGDLMMKCLYRVRPYEREPGSADALHGRLRDECVALLLKKRFSAGGYRTLCRRIVRAFDELPIREGVKKPRVGIVGEILVKYMPLANNHLVELLESRGAEVVVPEFLDFFEYSAYGRNFRRKYLGGSRSATVKSNALIRVLETVRRPAEKALAASARFSPDTSIQSKARLAEKYLSLGNQYGEGWFLTGEMANFLETGVPNIVCIQPFGCLPNHVVGKGAVKALRRDHPEANIAAVDYDPGASQVNQLNRIELMLSAAVKALERGN